MDSSTFRRHARENARPNGEKMAKLSDTFSKMIDYTAMAKRVPHFNRKFAANERFVITKARLSSGNFPVLNGCHAKRK